MAQWAGQFSGNTHETRRADAENALREAVVQSREAGAPLDREKALKLAAKVLFAREHVLNARLSAFTHVPTTERMEKNEPAIRSLRAKLEALKAGGLDAVLKEFGANDV